QRGHVAIAIGAKSPVAGARAFDYQIGVFLRLSDLRAACREPGKPLMPSIVDAVRAYATVGEITSTVQEVFGVFQEPAVI
ncbi:MAG: methylmalonyl-CoA mutase family protein, partial [Thermodesulfobacteriota bacterium]